MRGFQISCYELQDVIRFSGKIITDGPVTIADLCWLMSWMVSRQPHFKRQPEGHDGDLALWSVQ